VLSLVCFVDATKEMGTNNMSLQQAGSNKVLKVAVKSWFWCGEVIAEGIKCIVTSEVYQP